MDNKLEVKENPKHIMYNGCLYELVDSNVVELNTPTIVKAEPTRFGHNSYQE